MEPLQESDNCQDATLDVIKYDDGTVLLEGYKLTKPLRKCSNA